jgi:hypothetical protein
MLSPHTRVIGKKGLTVEAWAPVPGGEGGGVCLPGHQEELPGRRVHSLATGWQVSTVQVIFLHGTESQPAHVQSVIVRQRQLLEIY